MTAAVLATACGAVTAAVPLPATASATRSYTYVAAGFHVIGPDLAARIVAHETGVRTAPLGYVGVVADSDRLILRVEDHNPLSSDVGVTMVANGGWRRTVCAPRGRDVLVEGVPVGQRVSLYVWDAVPDHSSCPNSRPTTGTLTITS